MRDSGVVAIQQRAAEATDGPSQGAELEFGNSGVWEHMEGEGMEGKGMTGGREREGTPRGD